MVGSLKLVIGMDHPIFSFENQKKWKKLKLSHTIPRKLVNLKGKMMFHTEDNGFSMVFPNGLELSVRFATGNYCEHRNNENPPKTSKDAEIAVFRGNEQVFADGVNGTGYCGWLNTRQVAVAINLVATFDPESSPESKLCSDLREEIFRSDPQIMNL